MNNRRPQLYLDWGLAESQKCRSHLTASQARSDTQNLAAEGQSIADGIQKLLDQAQTTAQKLANSVGKDDQQQNVDEATALTKKLSIAASWADLVDQDLDAQAQRAFEFNHIQPTVAPVKTPEAFQLPPPVTNTTVAKALNSLKAIADSAAIKGADLRQAVETAIAIAAAPQPPSKPAAPAPLDQTAAAALSRFRQAQSLNPNWWRVSMALGDLVLNHYERQTPQGDMQPRKELPAGFRAALGDYLARPNANELPAPTAAPAAATPNDSQVLDFADKTFTLVIGQNPGSIDAYRDRAEVLRLKSELEMAAHHPQLARHDLTEAQNSANQACLMCAYRQSGPLRTLAQVDHDLKLDGPAADLAERSLAFLAPEELPLYQSFLGKIRAIRRASRDWRGDGPGRQLRRAYHLGDARRDSPIGSGRRELASRIAGPICGQIAR